MNLPRPDELLPHRGRMLLIDQVVSLEETRATCRVILSADSTFVEDGHVAAAVALEYMAQTVGVYAGAHQRAAGEAPRIGYLVAARDLVLHVPAFKVGDVLDVHVQRVWGEDRAGRFECVVHRAGVLVAQGSVSVYQPGPEFEGLRVNLQP